MYDLFLQTQMSTEKRTLVIHSDWFLKLELEPIIR